MDMRMDFHACDLQNVRKNIQIGPELAEIWLKHLFMQIEPYLTQFFTDLDDFGRVFKGKPVYIMIMGHNL